MSLLIDLHLQSVLASDAAIRAKVGTRIYPVVAPADSQFPCIIYAADEIEEEYTKDDCFMTCKATVTVMTKKHNELGPLCELVRKAFIENAEVNYPEFSVCDYTLTISEEDKDLVTDAYYRELRYSFDTDSYQDEQ